MKRDELAAYLDSYLQIKTIEDSSDKGLQVEGTASVARLAFAVDASFLMDQPAEAGADVYLTGEMSYNVYHRAKELDLSVIHGGYYATETAGLKSLAQHLAPRFDLETFCLELPTGA